MSTAIKWPLQKLVLETLTSEFDDSKYWQIIASQQRDSQDKYIIRNPEGRILKSLFDSPEDAKAFIKRTNRKHFPTK